MSLDKNVVVTDGLMGSNGASTIRSIPADSVQRIVAGQAICDLSSAVKELVDNALDAGSKSINSEYPSANYLCLGFLRRATSHSLVLYLPAFTVRLFNKGLDIIEVSDDGWGVPLQSRPFLATPHATSKIANFQEIYSTVSSMGFRGEALYSLANLSTNLIVATRTETDTMAQKMEFDKDGKCKDSVTDMPRKRGTTVAVVGLLNAIPVRRRDLEQRIQQHRSKLVTVMQGYAIFSTGVRINVMDMVKQKRNIRESTLLATAFNNKSLQDTVSSVLGTKFLASMTPIAVDLSDIVQEPNEKSSTTQWRIEGMVSTAGLAKERGVRQCQYFAINRRPVDLPKLSRALNECWRAFCSDRSPSCVIQLVLPNFAYDINLSPDKRMVLLMHETEICQVLQKALTDLWSNQTDGKFQANELDLSGNLERTEEQDNANDGNTEIGDLSSSSRLFHRRYAFVHDPMQAVKKEQDHGQRRVEFVSRRSSSQNQNHANVCNEETPPTVRCLDGNVQEQVGRKRPTYSEFSGVADATEAPEKRKCHRVHVGTSVQDGIMPSNISTTVTPSPSQYLNNIGFCLRVTGAENSSNKTIDEHDKLRVPTAHEQQLTSWTERRQWRDFQAKFNNDDKEDVVAAKLASSDQYRGFSVTENSAKESGKQPKTSLGLECFGFGVIQKDILDTNAPIMTELEPPESNKGNQIAAASHLKDIIPTRQSSLRKVVSSTQPENQQTEGWRSSGDESNGESTYSTFWASLQGTDEVVMASMRDRIAMRERRKSNSRGLDSPPCSSSQSESEGSNLGSGETFATNLNGSTATVSLSKADFSQMRVIGQFNMGFILALSLDGNLWILDQHACDEKFNFEALMAETIFHEQKLIAPLPLELSPTEETTVLANLKVFEANGFRLHFDDTKPTRQRLSLTAVPHSGARDGRKAVQFGKDDVSALCQILASDEDAPSMESGGTGIDGSGMYGNNAVRRYATGNWNAESTDRIIARLPKAIAMLASRACRSSIMIGTGLSEREMDRIVKRLSEVAQPWNCPHGRPTMRHVGDLHPFLLDDERRAAAHVAGPTITIMSQDDE